MTTRELLGTFTREEGIALFNSKKSDKQVYDILVSKGLTDSFETFISETQKVFNEKVSTMSKEEILAQIEGAELTDEQLEMIAGGNKNEYKKSENLTVGLTVGLGAVGIAVASSLISGSAAAAGAI